MAKKVFCIIIACVALLHAAATVIDTVMVPIKIMTLQSVTPQGADTLYNYSGKVTYHLEVGDRDSLNVGLKFIPVGGGDTVVPSVVAGDVGIRSTVNGINGTNSIYFNCSIVNAPLGLYTAQVTIAADTSRVEKITDSLVGLMSNFSSSQAVQEMDIQLCGNGSRTAPDDATLHIPGYYMVNGPQGICVGIVRDRHPRSHPARPRPVPSIPRSSTVSGLRSARKPMQKASIFSKRP